MDDRSKQIIERIKKQLESDGFKETKITGQSKTGFSDYDSFFDLMVDLKLEGKNEPTAEEIFNSMKQQFNYAKSLIAHAEKEYQRLKIQNATLEDQLKGKIEDEIRKK